MKGMDYDVCTLAIPLQMSFPASRGGFEEMDDVSIGLWWVSAWAKRPHPNKFHLIDHECEVGRCYLLRKTTDFDKIGLLPPYKITDAMATLSKTNLSPNFQIIEFSVEITILRILYF